MGDSSLFWLWFVLLVVVLIIWVIVKDCDDFESRSRDNCDRRWNISCAAEGTLLILAIPLLIFILFFILVGLVSLAERATTGCWMWDYAM